MRACLTIRAVVLAILAPVFLPACSPPAKPVAAAAPASPVSTPPAKPRIFTLDTPIDHIAADPQGKAVLDRDIPGLMASSQYPLFEDMTLSQIAMLSHGRLTQATLSLVKSDLIQISYLTPDPAAGALSQPAQ